MARTNEDAVKAVLAPGEDYDLNNNPDLAPFIDTASAIVDQAVSNASTYDSVVIGTSLAEIIERWLAAHLYLMSDQNLSSKTTNGASGNFQGQTTQGFAASKYGQTAMRADWTGNLRAIDERRFADAGWLGLPQSGQTSWEDRN